MYNVTVGAVRVIVVAVEKAKCIINFECVSVVLVIQHAVLMRRITFSSLTCLALPYFSTLSHKRYDFRLKFLNMKCGF